MGKCLSANVFIKNEYSSNNSETYTNNNNNNIGDSKNGKNTDKLNIVNNDDKYRVDNSQVNEYKKEAEEIDLPKKIVEETEESRKFQENEKILEGGIDIVLNFSDSDDIGESESLKTLVAGNDYEKYFEGKIDSERNLSGYDPDMVYAVCVASKEVARKKEKKQKQQQPITKKYFTFNIITNSNLFRRRQKGKCKDEKEEDSKNVIETDLKSNTKLNVENVGSCEEKQHQQKQQHQQKPSTSNYLTVPTAAEPQMNSNRSPSASVKDVEFDLINNCPLIWTRANSVGGRKVSVSERHQDDRLMVASACRKYTQMQYINQKIF